MCQMKDREKSIHFLKILSAETEQVQTNRFGLQDATDEGSFETVLVDISSHIYCGSRLTWPTGISQHHPGFPTGQHLSTSH